MGNSCAGKIAVVTGASRGIGAGIAHRLAAEGAKVVVTARSLRPSDRDLEGSLQETVDGITASGGEAIAVVADLADENYDRGEIVRAAHEAFGGPVDILVNNAAGPRGFEFAAPDLPASVFRQAVEINLWAAWDLLQRVVPGMRSRGAGWILNISSRQAAPRSGPPYPVHQHGGACLYGATKAFLDRFTTGAAMDLYPDNIAVNALSPDSAVMTPHAMSVATLSADHSEPPETMAEAALALCSAEPRSLTGKVAYSLLLLQELGRPVYDIDGKELLEGWQPDDYRGRIMRTPYLAPH
jgi:NAD(P)-dependent dehydrogenase (short-subunit alcohol dehydrogenase family)